MTIQPDTLMETYRVNTDRARHIADLALALFVETRPIHGLPDKKRHLLELAALLHQVGASVDPSSYHLAGRDIILGDRLPDLSDTERAMVACLIAFHRKKVRPEQEPAYVSLSKKNQQAVLRLAALLRIAHGLDASNTQSTVIEQCETDNKQLVLRLHGDHSGQDGAFALAQADLWYKVLDADINVSPDVNGAASQSDATSPAAQPDALTNSDSDEGRTDLTSQHTLAEVGRWLLRKSFRKLLSREDDTRADEDIEGVHQMRVATRKLRAILQIMSPVVPSKQVRHFRKELRKVANALAPVRDCDVFLEHVLTGLFSLPQAEQAGMTVLIDALQRDRAEAFGKLVTFLDSEPYADFKRKFAAFMTDEPQKWDTSLRVCDIVGSMIWQRYEALRMHDADVRVEGEINDEQEEAMHQARITGKRLRYVLEMFEEVLDPRAQELCMRGLKALQDHLGAVQDIAVARAYIANLKTANDLGPALESYRANREQERSTLLAEMPDVWERLMSENYRRDLARILVRL